jgi:molybdopterin/thiamine biosynthesis adenylyltransferase
LTGKVYFGMNIILSQEQRKRYSKALSLPGMNDEAQERLLAGSAIVIGLNGAGAIAAELLMDAGLGRLIMVDDDPRRLDSLKKKLISSYASDGSQSIECRLWEFDAAQSEQVLAPAHVVLEELNNWQDKLAISDVCMHLAKPLIHLGITGFRFQIFTMVPGKSACLRCAFPEVGIDDAPLVTPPIGQFGPVIAMAGAWQALQAIKLIARLGAAQSNELLKFDCLSGETEVIRGLDPHADCPDCGSFRHKVRS